VPFAVVLDTCVIYPAHLRDTLLRQAERGLFRVLWSDEILDELQRNLVARGGRVVSYGVARERRRLRSCLMVRVGQVDGVTRSSRRLRGGGAG
jgi:hypothetical protein